MKFRTDQAQAAYVELVAQTGRTVQAFRDELRAVPTVSSSEALAMALTVAEKSAEMSMRGLTVAIETAAAIDARLSGLAGSLAIAARGDGS